MAFKIIETIYNGHLFRSRLEARWAVFFDRLGIVWEYEYEGFNLDGVKYLPDFWLPDFNDGILSYEFIYYDVRAGVCNTDFYHSYLAKIHTTENYQDAVNAALSERFNNG